MIAQLVLERLRELGIPTDPQPETDPREMPEGAMRIRLGHGGVEVLAVEPPLGERDVEGIAPELPRLWLREVVTRQQAQRWIAEKRAFADTCGNAFLNLPGLVVRVLGHRPVKRVRERVGRDWRGPALRLLFHLLCDPELVALPIRELAAKANTAPGTVVRLFEDLEHTGHLIRLTRRERRLRADHELVDRWLGEYGRKLRPEHLLGRFTAEQVDGAHALDVRALGARWGGEDAAELLGIQLRPGIRTLYTREPIAPLLRAARLRKDPDGKTEVRRIFWEDGLPTERPDTTPTLLVIADLFAVRDGRCHAAGAELKQRWFDGLP